MPKAYVNWILFDEQFRPVSAGSGYDLTSTTSDAVKPHHATVTVPKGGYLYVYCSNESNIDVFFDNLQVIDTRGPLLETTNYYPFGLTMAGISSEAAGSLENKYKYNGKELQNKEFSDNSGLELYDYGARLQDLQLGIWHNIDKSADKPQNISISPYVYVADNPLKFVDPNGKDRIEHIKTIDKNGNYVEQTKVTKGEYRSVWNSTYGGGHYFTKNDYEVTTVNDYSSGKLKSTTTSETLHGSGHETEIGGFNYLKIKATGKDGPLIEKPQIALFGFGDVDMGSKADGSRHIEVFNMAESNEIIKLISLGQSLPDLKGADPSKIPEIILKWIDRAEEKAKKEAPDSAECPACKSKQDRNHIDRVNGKVTFDQLEKDHLTDKTQ